MSHYSKHYTCERCGYSHFHRLGEFKGENPTDRTKVCADCGHIRGTNLKLVVPTEWCDKAGCRKAQCVACKH